MSPTVREAVATRALTTRKPSGKPPWPIMLIAGAEKSGKSYAAAAASASGLVGRTFWIGIGEDDPDEYGAIPGARFEIVEHDGSYTDILAAITAAAAELATTSAPNMLVLDSATRLWDLLTDMAQAEANSRDRAKAAKFGRAPSVDDVQITMDLWNAAKGRWQHVMDALRSHVGPVIVTARLEQVTVMDAQGKPTTDKAMKVKAEKSLAYDAGLVVEMPARGETYLTHVRSLRWQPKVDRHGKPERTLYENFTIEGVWNDLGLAASGATAPRQHATNKPEDGVAAMLLAEIASLAESVGIGRAKIAEDWADEHGGEAIRNSTDLGSLELLRDGLLTRRDAAA